MTSQNLKALTMNSSALLFSHKSTKNFWRVYSSTSNVVAGGAPIKKPLISSHSIVEDLAPSKPGFAAQNVERNSPWSFLQYLPTVLQGLVKVPAKPVQLYSAARIIMKEIDQAFDGPGNTSEKLLPYIDPAEQQRFTLVLDVKGTLLDYVRKRGGNWRMFKRPGADEFLQHMAKFYEIVVYSDEPDYYLEPLCKELDENNFIQHRLSMCATTYKDRKYYRDLSRLNRDPRKILYVSGYGYESCLQPDNCIPIKPYNYKSGAAKLKGPYLETTLVDLIPFLEYVANNNPADIRTLLASYERKDVAKEFLEKHQRENARIEAAPNVAISYPGE